MPTVADPSSSPRNLADALRRGAALLEQKNVHAPRLTAEVLLAHALGCEKVYLYAHPERSLTSTEWHRFAACVDERCRGKPTQYITGVQEFYGLAIRVSPAVFIPRPETELLVEQALARATAGSRILDVGTGSGAIAIALQKHVAGARVFACEWSAGALAVARENARRLNAAVEFVRADVVEAFRADSFDFVVSNPPYIPLAELTGLQREVRDFEPSLALFGGQDGLDAYRRLSRTVGRVLRPGGWLLMEVGYNIRSPVEELLAGPPWEQPVVYADLAGLDRVVAVRKVERADGGGR